VDYLTLLPTDATTATGALFHLGLRGDAPYHPNTAGMAAVADLVADILTGLAGPGRSSR
jgi:hypothetical protein